VTDRDRKDAPTVEFSETQDLKSMDSQTGRRRRHSNFSTDAAAQAHRPVEIGEVLRDKYIVEEVIGEGGVGIVVAAHNLELDERVALKFLRTDVMNDPDIVARFAHEAKAAVAIKSEHVARVFDVGSTPKGVPFLVMEYLEGHDLSSELATRGTLQVKEAVEYALQACDALAAAHAKNIVHRDIKPDNLFLVDTGDNIPVIKVLDFGISKATITGSVFGSLLP
jgi:serine/threonine-protein kinase